MLEVKGLKKTFKMSKKQQKIEKTKEKIKVAVADVSFDARPGEILGILGANGAGKTTTLRILASVIKSLNPSLFKSATFIKYLPSKVSPACFWYKRLVLNVPLPLSVCRVILLITVDTTTKSCFPSLLKSVITKSFTFWQNNKLDNKKNTISILVFIHVVF